MPPVALRRAHGPLASLQTANARVAIDWDALERTVTLAGWTEGPQESRVIVEIVERVGFRPTAAAGLGPGRLALAGRDGIRVCLEVWQIEDALDATAGPTLVIREQRRVWEQVDEDSIGRLLWNPLPPRGVSLSLRGVWHQRRELVRYDVDALGWAVPDLEAVARGPAPRHVLHVPELERPLARTFQALRRERGLVLMLQSPTPDGEWMCEGPGPEVSLALLDRDRDGRLDEARRLDGPTWNAEDWGQLDTYERLLDY